MSRLIQKITYITIDCRLFGVTRYLKQDSQLWFFIFFTFLWIKNTQRIFLWVRKLVLLFSFCSDFLFYQKNKTFNCNSVQ